MNMSETSEPFVDTIQGWDVSVGENGHEPAMGTTSEEERPLICVEVLIKPSSTLSDSDVALQVRKFIKVRLFGQRSRPLPVGQFVTIKDLNFQLKITGGPLADHVDQISFEESEGKLAVMLSCFADARWGVYCFKVESDPPTAESSGEDIPSAVHRILPNREYLQLWESLLYDSSIKSDLLKYATDTVLFSKLGIDSNLVTWNKVILLHGPPGTGKTSLCKALAQKLSIRLSEHYPGVYLIEINSHSLFSRWFSESGKLVMKMFQGIENIVKQNNALVCLLIDEVESLARARQAAVSGNEPSDAVRAVNALLTQIDKIKQYPNVLILTTSNMSEAIDLAFVDRADIKQYIGNPSEDAIICIYISSLEELMKREVLSSDPALVSSEENHVRSLIRKIARKPVAPPTQWAQRKEVVYVSILAEDVKDLDVKIDAAKVHFSGKSGPEQKEYAVDLELFAEVDPETSKYVVKDRLIDITLKKKECDSPFWPRLLKGTGKPGWLKTDFGRWKDEDEEGADEDAGDSGADFQSMMHQMGGAGGMGMGGMGMGGGDDAFPPYDPKDDVDSDDENGDPEDMPKLEE